jgi:hypothetical protein
MSHFTMRPPRTLTALFAGLALIPGGLISAAPAAASPTQVLADCNANGHLTGTYSRSDLRGALNGMGADTREYTNCYDVVRRALLSSAAAGGARPGGGSTSGGGGSSSTSARNATGLHSGASGANAKAPGAKAARSGSGRAVALDGSTVQPGSTGGGAGSGSSSLPAPLIGVLVILVLAALSGGGIALRRRVVARHGG